MATIKKDRVRQSVLGSQRPTSSESRSGVLHSRLVSSRWKAQIGIRKTSG